MAKFTANHTRLYFDTLCRTQKGESVLSLIYATYQAKKNGGGKEEIAKRLENAYNLFKTGAGSYSGELKQFESQYTIGHELCIWKNSDLELTDLAIKVAENYITIRDYFDIVFLNYIQPVNGEIVHLLYHLLEYMNDNNINTVSKDDMARVYMRVGKSSERGEINGAYNMLIASSYFKSDELGKELVYCGKVSIAELMARCNLSYVEKGYEIAKQELASEQEYIKYLLHDHRANVCEDMRDNKRTITGGSNILLYGVPGSGKSHTIKNICGDEIVMQRVVFHPDYTYSDFVGQIMPRVNGDKLEYVFSPGPFTKILQKAKENPSKMHYLVIEEINRGNAPAIFGEVFQLLDRNDDETKGLVGESEYGISNYEIAKEVYEDPEHLVKIPPNLSILATMNTSDQNVFTLDTAFQRRWELRHIKNNVLKAKHANNKIEDTEITWGAFASVINDKIDDISYDMSGLEDKRLGAYFAKEDELRKGKFPEKVLKYLWDDAFKMDKEAIFNDNIKSFDNLLSIYEDATPDKLKWILNYDVYGKMLNKVNKADEEKEDNN